MDVKSSEEKKSQDSPSFKKAKLMMTITLTRQLLATAFHEKCTPTVATKMSQSSHQSRKLDALLATKRSATAMSGRAKKMLKIAYNFGAWVS